MNPLIPEDGVYNLSANKLSMFNACPFKLYLYLSHQDTGEVDEKYLRAGNCVHKFMEDSINGCVKGVEDYINEFEVPESTQDRVKTCIEHSTPYVSLKGQTELTEYKKFKTPKGRDINLMSRIDLQCEDADIEGANKKLVIDWKTGKTINKPEYKMQMQVYRFMKNQEYDAMLVSLLTGETLLLNKSAEDYIPKMCDLYVDAIESNSFEKKPNAMCQRFCPYYKNFCSPEHEFDLIVPKMTWDNEQKKWVE